jgi:hypothetical protein
MSDDDRTIGELIRDLARIEKRLASIESRAWLILGGVAMVALGPYIGAVQALLSGVSK